MSTEPSSQFPKPRIDVRALLGLYDPADKTDWGPIRAAQLHAGRQLALFLLAANLVGAALIVMLFDGHAPRALLVGWGVVTGVVGIAVAVRRLATRHRDASTATLRDVRHTMLEGIALAVVWSVPPLALGARADIATAMGLWILLSVMMTASAVAMAALPMATLSFLGIMGSAIVTMLLMLGSPLLAAATALFVVLLMIGCFQRCKALVVIRASEIGLAERDETVSLLLREFEEEDGDWLWETDSARRIVRASPRFARSVHLDPVKINGMPLLQALAAERWESGDFSAGLRLLADKLKGREPFRDLLLQLQVRDQLRWFALAATPRYDDLGSFLGFRGVGRDITAERESADQINRMARFDVLTGLPNRLQLNEQLARAMAEADKWGTRCGFMMIDLDRFKAVNDSLGHPVGDRLLGQVSERLARLVTDNELIGRLGGDEFAVVVRDASDGDRVDRLARAIIDTLSKPYEMDAHTLFIGASVGIAIGPRDGRTAEMLIRSADLALYRSKDSGGGAFNTYEPQLHIKAEERRVLEMALRQALEKGELHLEYQPVVAAGDGRLAGFEALLRWTHPELGVVPPSKFVPLAEDARLIVAMGEWVLRSACAEAAKWPSPTRIAVNVSPEQLHNPAFVSVVASALANSGLPAERLELEVTEGVFMREGTGAVQVLERILDLGVRLSLDDFGTGYSSLGYLARTRFSTIKVDRSFVQGASKGQPEPIAIIRAVVALAQSLGMATTAEGVETEQEHQMIQELGCTKVQGYYFGRPLPVAEARALANRKWNDQAAA
ncbi:MAG: EAL domain-containing protein [Sphingomonas sp.]